MQCWMRFVEDTQVAGRFFPKGAEVRVIQADGDVLLPPDTGAHTTLCALPMRNLVRLQVFRVLLQNRFVGLEDLQIRRATDEAELRAFLARRVPDCAVVSIEAAADPLEEP